MTSRSRGLVFSDHPYPDESFVGYLVRLTEINDYDNASWILQLAKFGEYARKESLAFGDDQDFTSLAYLTGVDPLELRALTYLRQGRKSNKFCDSLIFGLPVPRTAINLNPAKICPGCLREHRYVRRIWELTIVTTCPLHECLLLDECPNCRRRLDFMRSRISICKCQYDWRDASPVSLAATEMDLT